MFVRSSIGGKAAPFVILRYSFEMNSRVAEPEAKNTNELGRSLGR